eukprot:GCRY01000936.1.p1 GENE.GCRY01000936.1~~GCRY01000936.1.p1  ORF type:complete len:190 (-),score=28.71 GCRY01000936.1:117-686(-)
MEFSSTACSFLGVNDLSSDTLKDLCDRISQFIINGQKQNEIENVVELEDSLISKNAVNSIFLLYLEGAKNNVNSSEISNTLQENDVEDDLSSVISSVYKDNAVLFQNSLKAIDIKMKKILDIDWRVDQTILGSAEGKKKEPSFLLSVTVQEPTGAITKELLTLNRFQLQYFVSQLKDASKEIERVSNVS